ncbi:hypothetical protein EW146_g198 [Bondarzewia mesenterica]|uniref:Uncharacterized protein n=1 Tax=Bondarzewia mesenterica TaxID=1095465 RepID=A0A4S4M8B0_9AGAM|nr:hypothetical protein EW146_g198 [Bondarzewia mesenterica]
MSQAIPSFPSRCDLDPCTISGGSESLYTPMMQLLKMDGFGLTRGSMLNNSRLSVFSSYSHGSGKYRPCLIMDPGEYDGEGVTIQPPSICAMGTFSGTPRHMLATVFQHFVVPIAPNPNCREGEPTLHTIPSWHEPSQWLLAYEYEAISDVSAPWTHHKDPGSTFRLSVESWAVLEEVLDERYESWKQCLLNDPRCEEDARQNLKVHPEFFMPSQKLLITCLRSQACKIQQVENDRKTLNYSRTSQPASRLHINASTHRISNGHSGMTSSPSSPRVSFQTPPSQSGPRKSGWSRVSRVFGSKLRINASAPSLPFAASVNTNRRKKEPITSSPRATTRGDSRPSAKISTTNRFDILFPSEKDDSSESEEHESEGEGRGGNAASSLSDSDLSEIMPLNTRSTPTSRGALTKHSNSSKTSLRSIISLRRAPRPSVRAM